MNSAASSTRPREPLPGNLPGLSGSGPRRRSNRRRRLKGLPPLVLAAECDQLKERLASVALGEAFAYIVWCQPQPS